jgi:hypothetical protein
VFFRINDQKLEVPSTTMSRGSAKKCVVWPLLHPCLVPIPAAPGVFGPKSGNDRFPDISEGAGKARYYCRSVTLHLE